MVAAVSNGCTVETTVRKDPRGFVGGHSYLTFRTGSLATSKALTDSVIAFPSMALGRSYERLYWTWDTVSLPSQAL